MSASQEEPDAEEDFDTYLPVFLYSHASFADYDEDCKVANPKVSGEITKEGLFKSFKTQDDFFTTVPENMIVVDPIPSGLLCMSGWSLDELFPAFINSYGNKTFLQNDLPIKDIKNAENVEIDSRDIDALQHLYNNRKVYYSGDEINNFRITFDVNSGSIPWGIRFPIYENKDQNVFNSYSGHSDIEMIREDWSRQYSNAKKNECIYLDEVLIKIREFVDDIYNHRPKIMLYMISCRNHPDYDDVYEHTPIFKNLLLQRQLAVNINGIKNVPYGSTTDRELRGQETFVGDGSEEFKKQLYDIQDIQLKSTGSRIGGKKRYNNKRNTRKKQTKKQKKNKNSGKVRNVKKGSRERVNGLNQNREGFENQIQNIEGTKHMMWLY